MGLARRLRRHRALAAALALLAIFLASAAQADERIHRFAADIVIGADGVIDVTETIELTAEGDEIRRGIVRQFPVEYEGWGGFDHSVRFDVVSVTRDGRPEPWATEDNGDLVDLRIGDAGKTLSWGRHTYVIRYRTDYQIGFRDGHDEFYWNVTGNGWVFWMDEAEATIRLPGGARPTELAVFTGYLGETGKNATIAETEPGIVTARTTEGLSARKGLSIGVAFPKGYVTPPSFANRVWRWAGDNPGGIIAFLGALALAAYGWFSRWREGPDPEPGDVVPLFDPPDDLTPADARFLDSFTFDDTSFAATIIGLAAKGYLKIEKLEQDGKEPVFQITRLAKGTDIRGLPAPERMLMKKLLGGKLHHHRFEKSNGSETRTAYAAVKDAVEQRHLKTNIRQRADKSVGCTLLVLVFAVLIVIYTSGWASWLIALAGFIAMIYVAFRIDSDQRAATRAGQQRRDQLAGLRMYMSTAEEGRWNALHPPALTPARFEALFPFALALGIDQDWSEQFRRQLLLQGADPAAYAPSFYSGSDFNLSDGIAFSHSFSSSVSPPPAPSASYGGSSVSSSGGSAGGFSDSSFSSGGGYSGGGGGGGGGHGW